MQRWPERNIRTLLLASVVLAALGMEVDICSGPLPPTDGLALILGAISSDRRADDATAESVNAGPCDGSRSVPDDCDSQQRQPRKLVSAAEWPVPLLLLKCRYQTKRNVTFAPSAVEAPSSRATGSSPSVLDVSLSSHFYPPDQLCRLNC